MKTFVKAAVVTALITPTLFAANIEGCKGCHGANFEKAAMGVSKVVKDMSKEQIIASLKGYKAGTYGGNMKTIMKGQADPLDDKAIEEVAAEIKK